MFYSVLQYVVVRPVRQHTYADTLERYIVGCTSGHAHKNVLYSDLVYFLRVRACAWVCVCVSARVVMLAKVSCTCIFERVCVNVCACVCRCTSGCAREKIS